MQNLDDDSYEMSADEERPHHQHHHHHAPHPHLHMSPPRTEPHHYTSVPPQNTPMPPVAAKNRVFPTSATRDSASGAPEATTASVEGSGAAHADTAGIGAGAGDTVEPKKQSPLDDSASSVSDSGTCTSYSNSEIMDERSRLLGPAMRPGKKPNPRMFKRQATFNL
jgi:hypothetical protein